MSLSPFWFVCQLNRKRLVPWLQIWEASKAKEEVWWWVSEMIIGVTEVISTYHFLVIKHLLHFKLYTFIPNLSYSNRIKLSICSFWIL